MAGALGSLAKASNESVDLKYMQKAVKDSIGALPRHIFDGMIGVIEAIGIIGICYKDVKIWAGAGGA